MARKIFYDNNLQTQFEHQGYVVVDLLSPTQVSILTQLFDEVEGAKGTANSNLNSYELSFFDKNPEKKKWKFEAINKFLGPIVNKLLNNYKPFIINLFNKQSGLGEVPVHQNWTFVDEEHFTSLSLWCPLQEVSRENGTLEVVPGTHKVICNYRGPSIPWVFTKLNQLLIDKYMIPCNLQIGQVVILDDSIIHYSGVNRSDVDRKAIQLILKPSETPLIHCYISNKEKETINIIDVDDDFFFDFDMWRQPQQGRNLRHVPYTLQDIDEEQLLHRRRVNLNS